MECAACDDNAFSLHEDGSIRCHGCGGKTTATWAKTSQPQTDAEPSGAA